MKILSMVIYLFLIIYMTQGCVGKREAAQYKISDGIYSRQIFGGQDRKVYLDNEEEYLKVIPLLKRETGYEADTFSRPVTYFPQEKAQDKIADALFYSSGIDVDLITIPFKYRFSSSEFPHQLNTNFNALLYMGYRTDFYTVGYEPNAISQLERYTRHYGVTLGLFSGFGGTAMNPSVTKDQIQIEYDGIVWSYGLAGSLGFNDLTLGIALGFDQLLDGNSSVWIYQKKPWLGLVLGINLN